MENRFSKLMSRKSDDELKEYSSNSTQFQKEAVLAAEYELNKRKLSCAKETKQIIISDESITRNETKTKLEYKHNIIWVLLWLSCSFLLFQFYFSIGNYYSISGIVIFISALGFALNGLVGAFIPTIEADCSSIKLYKTFYKIIRIDNSQILDICLDKNYIQIKLSNSKIERFHLFEIARGARNIILDELKKINDKNGSC